MVRFLLVLRVMIIICVRIVPIVWLRMSRFLCRCSTMVVLIMLRVGIRLWLQLRFMCPFVSFLTEIRMCRVPAGDMRSVRRLLLSLESVRMCVVCIILMSVRLTAFAVAWLVWMRRRLIICRRRVMRRLRVRLRCWRVIGLLMRFMCPSLKCDVSGLRRLLVKRYVRCPSRLVVLRLVLLIVRRRSLLRRTGLSSLRGPRLKLL